MCMCMYDSDEKYLYVHEMNGDTRIILNDNKHENQIAKFRKAA